MKKEALIFLVVFGLSFVFAMTGYVIEGSSPSLVTINGLRVIYDTFDGSTTDFDSLNGSQLDNLSGMILEKISYGKVSFFENVNLSLTGGIDRTVDFDSYFNISDNLVYVNSGELPWLNKTVQISLYGISYTNPKIIKQGVECTDCSVVSYSGGTFVFNTTKFEGPYYLQETSTGPTCGNGVCEDGETSTSCPEDCSSSSGGGGGEGSEEPGEEPSPSERGYDFYIEPDFFTVRMNGGEYFQKRIKVVNNGSKDQKIFIGVSGLNLFIFPQVESFDLPAGQNKTVRLNIYVSDKRDPDVYVGKVIFRSSEMEKYAKVILDVKSKSALFDIRTNVLKKYINPGGRARANVSIINFGTLRDFDVNLEYLIVDFDNNNYTIKKEDFAMNKTYNNIFC